MKKWIVTLMLFLSNYIFSAELPSYYSKIIQNRINIIEAVQMFKERKIENAKIVASVIDADEFLKQTAENEVKFEELVLVFPSVDYVEKYITNIDKKVKKVKLVFLEDKSNEAFMEKRDYGTFEEKNISLPKTVKVYKVKVDEIDVSSIFPNSLTKSLEEDEIIIKYVKGIIEE